MDDDEMFAPEEAAALGPKGRRQIRWVSVHRDLNRTLAELRERFGERHAGASIDAVGDAFRYHVYLRDLTEPEADAVRADLGAARNTSRSSASGTPPTTCVGSWRRSVSSSGTGRTPTPTPGAAS